MEKAFDLWIFCILSFTHFESVLSSESCDIYKTYKSEGSGFITSVYNGIPQNLILNVIGWILFMLLFSILRKNAWNYGRMAINENVGDGKNFAGIFYGSLEKKLEENTKRLDGDRIHVKREKAISDTGFFTWILIVFNLTDSQFYAKSGIDAVLYLSFQRHLIVYCSIVTLTCIAIVLPINVHEASGGIFNLSIFQTTTINNVDRNSNFLWVHVFLSVAFLFLGIVVMRHFSKSLLGIYDDPIVLQTVMIIGIPKRFCNERILDSHFGEAYPDVDVKGINFAYDIAKLKKHDELRISSESALADCNAYLDKYQTRPTMRPFAFGIICCCCKSTDAIDFYMERVVKFTIEATVERRKALETPVGIAFVTFANKFMAERVVEDYREMSRLMDNAPKSSVSLKLKTRTWLVHFAPEPEELYWENLNSDYVLWYLKAFLVNVTLLLLILFFTTPVIFLNRLNGITDYFFTYKITNQESKSGSMTTQNSNSNSSSIKTTTDVKEATLDTLITNSLPQITLLITAVALPGLVVFTDKIIGFWTKEAETRSKMLKSFIFLLFMIIILPSLGQISITAILSQDVSWHCALFSSNVAFFINYVATSSFLGTAGELLRLSELLLYVINLLVARSRAEMSSIRRAAVWDFQIGTQYAWMLIIFAIFIMFSIVAPLICPFGLVYFILKHFVDRYNIYFAYGPCKIDKDIHKIAVNFVLVSLFLLQAVMLFFTNLTPAQTDSQNIPIENKPMQVFSIISFTITACLLAGQFFFDYFSTLTPAADKDEDLEEAHSNDSDQSGDFGLKLDDSEKHRISKGRYFPSILRTPLRAPMWARANSPKEISRKYEEIMKMEKSGKGDEEKESVKGHSSELVISMENYNITSESEENLEKEESSYNLHRLSD